MTRQLALLLALLLLLGACGAPTVASSTAAPTTAAAQTVAAAVPKIVASTSWAAAFARAAGATDITVIAPANVQHPPDYDPKPADLAALAGADYVLLGGFEGFAKRMQEAVGGDEKKLITLKLENTPETIHAEVTRLGELFGTSDKASAFLKTFDAEYARLSGELKAKVGANKPVVVAHLFMTPWAAFAGLEVAATYGPAPVTPEQLRELAAAKPAIIFDNAHIKTGQPVVEATGAKAVELINFPGENLELLDVFTTNAERIMAVVE